MTLLYAFLDTYEQVVFLSCEHHHVWKEGSQEKNRVTLDKLIR